MKLIIKESKYPPRLMYKPEEAEVETEGYDAITASSRPPYGPHAKKHGARVFGSSVVFLRDVRVVSGEIEGRLEALEAKIVELREEHRQLLADNFLTFRLAKVEDFQRVRQGHTKEQAEAQLPQGAKAKADAVRHGKQMAGLSKALGSMLRR